MLPQLLLLLLWRYSPTWALASSIIHLQASLTYANPLPFWHFNILLASLVIWPHFSNILDYLTSLLPYFILSHVQPLIQYYLPSNLSCNFISRPISHAILFLVPYLMQSYLPSHLSCYFISRLISHVILSPVLSHAILFLVPSLMQSYLPFHLSCYFISRPISHVILSPFLSLM